ncbi:LRR receptor serine/threonine-protein kinase [Salix suchowensis]|nr:LRR receptor serine/threonine-protein kinase [Salix suchowensis]
MAMFNPFHGILLICMSFSLETATANLVGSIPPSIGNLTYLTGINLRNNSFHGELPEELGRLSRLQHFNVTFNFFGGRIPTNLSHCTELTVLNVGGNKLTGEIPHQISSLTKLVTLKFGGNHLTGSIPSGIGNLTSLFSLSLLLNNLRGSIPNELGQLTRLGFFQVYGNYLSVFAGGVNYFTGPIPVSLSNASGLQILDFAINGLTGGIPKNLGSLKSLVRLNFDQNNLGNGEVDGLSFLSVLANCTSLEVLGLAENNFGGELHNSIGNLSAQLRILTLGRNLFHGNIPVEISNLVNLSLLGLEGNYLTGSVPDLIGKLKKLEGLHLNVNRFSGSIPSALGNLTRLARLFLEENRFGGNIPSSLGNCKSLQNLNLSSNNLNGTIPKEVLGLSSLSISLVMSNNYLTGSLSLEVGKLQNLMQLDISGNRLWGTIPSTLGSCVSLERLHLERNKFEGPIPESFKTLRGLEELDLSENNLTGRVPGFLAGFSALRHLNLSFNNLEGEVSRDGIFANASAFSVVGNDKLCGGIPELHLPTCSRKKPRETLFLKIVIPATIVAVFISVLLISLSIFYIRRELQRHSNTPSPEEQQVGISYLDLVKSTNGFAAENLIGSGSFGSVYKGILFGEGRIVAIKIINLLQKGASKSFIDECNALRSIRHRNLLKIITVCSSVDHQGNDFKGLVFEFMSNGNLDQWLHPASEEQNRTRKLSFTQRLNIAFDVASALDYLHHHCETTIVHCDLKPSNVLLDDDMTAHVGDFGLAKLLSEASRSLSINPAISATLKGSIGYIPPEYGMTGEVSVLGDIYSYGILLLEMFTGKRPTDDMFKGDVNIHKFADMAFSANVMAIIDPSMLAEEEIYENEITEHGIEEREIIHNNEFQANRTSNIEECLVSVMEIGLSCSDKSPGKRMAMNIVVKKLQKIRDSFSRSINRTGKKVAVDFQ